jgi:hypothetical protein
VLEALLKARRILALAAVAVVLASSVIVTAFYRHISVPCRGILEAVPLEQLRVADVRVANDEQPAGGDVYLDFDRVAGDFSNVRVWFAAPEGECACKSQLTLPKSVNPSAPLYGVFRRTSEPDLYVVHGSTSSDPVFAFRKVDTRGHVFQWKRALQTGNVSMLILLGAMGSLLGGYFLLARASSYATGMQHWRSARRRDDGLLEDETGGAIARLGRTHIRDTDVLVNPACLERAVYRELPLLDRRDVAPGSHHRWMTGTMRRFRDAQVLAVLATMTTALSVAAHFYA